jgi:endonuclease-8
MPEGDTVYLAARNLGAALRGHVIRESDFRVPQLATADLVGCTTTDVISVGKHLLFRFDDGRTLHTHFRMDGSWHLYRPGVRWSGGPMWQVRLLLRTDEWQAVGYRLPVVDLIATADEGSLIGHLGPDLLGPGWDLAEALRRLAAQPMRPIGEALLDQRTVAGLGLIYVTESLFLHGVTPWTPVGEVADHDALMTTARRLLTANKDRYIQSTTGDLERGRWHYVYERSGRACRRCGGTVRSATQGTPPHERFAYWCSTCQDGPAPEKGPAGGSRTARAPRPTGRTRYKP